ncbi:ABC transporter permease [Candidatus Laterigemmans baculatus]|uniref:ABC transporter permease n=1 Tax=Candidatus Laterigemmans baculatus TaxID=2770505 RepID=UPI0013DA00E3|nr:ABC transporter permease [Candidatus Laterigemmans baculatus]
MKRPLILHHVTVEAGGQRLLSDVSVEMPDGQITVIVGGSGAGKSVLLRILAGLIPQTDGVIRWTGAIDHGPGGSLGRIGIVFQQFALFDELSPLANVRFAVDHRRRKDQPPEQTPRQWLEELRVPVGVPVAALSGGQKQRLAIARTLAADPEVVLYDEPTSGLDAASGRQVARLIRRTQETHRRTSIVVTHDYETLLPIADHVLLLDSETKQLVPVPRQQWEEIPDRMQPVRRPDDPQRKLEPPAETPPDAAKTPAAKTPAAKSTAAKKGGSREGAHWLGRSGQRSVTAVGDLLETSGHALLSMLRLPLDLIPRWPRVGWGLRFLAHYLRLVCGPSAWVYLWFSGLIVGFTSTYFTFRFLPYELYTKPLLLEDLLAAIGFALYRVLVPVLATVLVAARCGAAVAADVGVKRYGAQVEALQTLGVRPPAYLLTPILIAFIVGTPILEAIAFHSARLISMVSFIATHPQQGPYFWELHFASRLHQSDSLVYNGFGWLMLKTVLCGVGVAAISYYRGLRPKQSARDVSEAITSTVLWATLYVLFIHFLIAFYEF